MDADVCSGRTGWHRVPWIPVLIVVLAVVNVPVVVDAIAGGSSVLGWASAAVWAAAAGIASVTVVFRWRNPPTRQGDVPPAAVDHALALTGTKYAAARKLRSAYPRLSRFDARLLVGLTPDSPGAGTAAGRREGGPHRQRESPS